MLLLVPADPLSGRRPEEYFAPEVKAAKGLGFEVCTVDHDALAAGDADAAVSRVVGGHEILNGDGQITAR